MRYLPFLACLLLACQPGDPPARSVDAFFAPASPPRVYTAFSEVAPLFEQRDDTTYLINFWATWCKPCLEELPLLQQLQEESANKPLRIVLISLDTEPEAIARIPAYLSEGELDLPSIVLTDEGEGWKRSLDENWDGSLPTTFIYRNTLRYVYRRNFRTLLDVQDAVKPLLSQ